MTGGKNSRMGGAKKLFLEYQGRTFLDYILEAMADFEKIYLSVESGKPYEHLQMPMVIDEIAEIGPLGGIYSGLRTCKEEAIFVVACDMPFISKEAIRLVWYTFQSDGLPVIAEVNGRLHPLFGIYTKELLPHIEEMIQKKNYRMVQLVKRVGIKTIDLHDFSKEMQNVNSQKEYMTL